MKVDRYVTKPNESTVPVSSIEWEGVSKLLTGTVDIYIYITKPDDSK